jgi:hypothetical protein
MQNANYAETFTGRMDLIFVRYSETKNDISNNNRFRYEGNLVKVRCIWEITCSVFEGICCCAVAFLRCD